MHRCLLCIAFLLVLSGVVSISKPLEGQSVRSCEQVNLYGGGCTEEDLTRRSFSVCSNYCGRVLVRALKGAPSGGTGDATFCGTNEKCTDCYASVSAVSCSGG